MAKILNWINVQKILKEKNLLIFRPRDLVRLFNVSQIAANFFVYRYTKRGLLVRLKKSQKESLYAIAEFMPSQFLIANRIYEPSYISFDTAMSFYNLIPEVIYSVTSVTTKATRKFIVANINYQYFRIKQAVYTGYRPIKYMNNIIFMAEPEKALADYLYFVNLKKRDLHYDRIALNKIKKTKLLNYIKLFKQSNMMELIEKLYDNFRKSQRIY